MIKALPLPWMAVAMSMWEALLASPPGLAVHDYTSAFPTAFVAKLNGQWRVTMAHLPLARSAW